MLMIMPIIIRICLIIYEIRYEKIFIGKFIIRLYNIFIVCAFLVFPLRSFPFLKLIFDFVLEFTNFGKIFIGFTSGDLLYMIVSFIIVGFLYRLIFDKEKINPKTAEVKIRNVILLISGVLTCTGFFTYIIWIIPPYFKIWMGLFSIICMIYLIIRFKAWQVPLKEYVYVFSKIGLYSLNYIREGLDLFFIVGLVDLILFDLVLGFQSFFYIYSFVTDDLINPMNLSLHSVLMKMIFIGLFAFIMCKYIINEYIEEKELEEEYLN